MVRRNAQIAADLAWSRQQAEMLSAAVQQAQAAAAARELEHLRLCDFLRQELQQREQAAAKAARDYKEVRYTTDAG